MAKRYYKVNEFDNENDDVYIKLFQNPQDPAQIKTATAEDIIYVNEELEKQGSRIKVLFALTVLGDGPELWMEEEDLENGQVSEITLSQLYENIPSVAEGVFVYNCATRHISRELATAGHPTAGSAEFLIALAKIISRFKNEGDLLGNGAQGPFQFSTIEWQAYLNADQNTPLTAHRRGLMLDQISVAQYYVQKHYDDFTAKKSASLPASDQAEGAVARYVDIFLTWIFGSDIAVEISKLAETGEGSTTMETLLGNLSTGDLKRAREISKRAEAALGNLSTRSVTQYVSDLEQELTKQMKNAVTLLKKHASDLLPKNPTGVASYMAVVQKELDHWATTKEPNGTQITETSDLGDQRVKTYFQAINRNDGGTTAWCGAFAGYINPNYG